MPTTVLRALFIISWIFLSISPPRCAPLSTVSLHFESISTLCKWCDALSTFSSCIFHSTLSSKIHLNVCGCHLFIFHWNKFFCAEFHFKTMPPLYSPTQGYLGYLHFFANTVNFAMNIPVCETHYWLFLWVQARVPQDISREKNGFTT